MDEEENNITSTTSPNNDRKGFNIASLVLGIISVILFCCWYACLPAGILAIIFSIAGKDSGGRGMGIAGMVLGIIGLILCILVYGLIGLGIASYNYNISTY